MSEQALHADLMFVDGVVFLVSVAHPLGLTIATHLPQGKGLLPVKKGMFTQIGMFKTQGFVVTAVLFDGESAIGALANDLAHQLGVPIIPVAPGSHVGKVERKIRQIKERMRCVVTTLPYKLPLPFIPWLLYYCVTRINMLPSRLAVDRTSPREAFSGRKTNYKRDLCLPFGDYVQVHRENIVKNAVDVPRTEGAIALLPTGSLEGSCKFYILRTDRVVTRARWTTMPSMPQEVVDLLNALADKKRKDRAEAPLLFRTGTPDGPDNVTPVDDDPPLAEILPEPPTHVVQPGIDDSDTPEQPLDDDQTPVVPTTTVEVPVVTEEVDAEINQDTPLSESIDDDDDEAEDLAERMSEEPPEILPTDNVPHSEPRYNLRERTTNWRTRERVMLNVAFAQYRCTYNLSLADAITEYSQGAYEAVHGELSQILDKKVFHPMRASTLDAAARRSVIPSKMFLKEKFLPNGLFDKLKARLVAGGHRQNKNLYDIEDISSPTVALTSALMIATIAAMEKRTVATVDITGAYLNADMGSTTVLMRLDSLTAAILVKIKPEYQTYLEPSGTMIVQLDKALYGCVESAKLWYQHLINTLEKIGFVRNPHDDCILNCTMEGSQCTVCVYVDDLLITSTQATNVQKVIEALRSTYKTITEHTGSVHNYLGMQFDFTTEGAVKVSMKGYIEGCMDAYQVKGTADTPAVEALFDTRESTLLDASQADEFHSRVAKLLYLAKRVRPDILTAISYLTTRVRNPNVDDWNKLDRVLRYLNKTRELGIKLSANRDDFRVITYVDASYGKHADCKSHTGLCISLGSGPIFARSSKQKIVTKSSSEAELVGCSDSVSQAIWTRYFLLAQGYPMGPVTVNQDNTSTMSLIDNGKPSSDRSRHINIRYFWIKDRIGAGEVKIVHLNTTEMLADILTKPLAKDQFEVIRGKLLGD